MIGRDEELGRLSALLARARNGERQLALVTGEAGLGKSRLLAEASSAAIAQGFEVLTGLCHPGDHAIPLAPFVDAIRQRIGGLSTSDARSFLGSACPTLAGVIPEIATICVPGVVLRQEPEQAKQMVFESIASLLVHRAMLRPVLLILDDLQWADPTSVALLALLARRTNGHRVALVATILVEDRQHAFDSTLLAVRRLPDAQEIPLPPLDGPSTEQLLAVLLPVPPSAPLVAEIERRSGGNPLFIQALAAARGPTERFDASAAAAVPPDLSGLLLRPLDDLSDRHRAIVEVASVIGQDVSESIVAQACGWEPDLVSDAFADAQRTGIVRPSMEAPGRGSRVWRFHHELTREAIYERIAPSRRRKLHGQVAEAMSRAAGMDRNSPPVAPGTLGRHLHAAGEWQAALVHCQIAADAARRMHATHEALVNDRRALDAALAVGDPAACMLHLHCGQDLALLGDAVGADVHLREAERCSNETGVPEIRQAAIDGLASLAASRDYVAAEHLARQSLRLAEQLEDERTIARSLNRLGNILTNGLRFSEGRTMHQDALARFGLLDDAWGVADALDLIAMTHYLGGEIPRARDVFGQAAARFEELNDSERLASALTSRGLYLAVLDGACENDIGAEGYAPDAERGLDLARTIGWRAGEAYALAALACAALGSGEIATARRRSADARAVAVSIEHPQWTLLADFVAGLIEIAINDKPGARTRFEAAFELAVSTGSVQWTDRLSAWIDGLSALEGDVAARDRLVSGVDRTSPAPEGIGHRRSVIALATCELGADPGAALRLLERLSASGQRPSAEVLLVRGEAFRLHGFVEEADQDLLRADAIAQASGPRPLIWRIAAARARVWEGRDGKRRADAIATARRELIELVSSADEADRSTLFRSAEARAVLGPGKRAAAMTPRTLSRREQQVAECVARGLRNKEIAEELGITSKTVEMHVANAIAKLGVPSRASLAVWTASAGNPDRAR